MRADPVVHRPRRAALRPRPRRGSPSLPPSLSLTHTHTLSLHGADLGRDAVKGPLAERESELESVRERERREREEIGGDEVEEPLAVCVCVCVCVFVHVSLCLCVFVHVYKSPLPPPFPLPISFLCLLYRPNRLRRLPPVLLTGPRGACCLYRPPKRNIPPKLLAGAGGGREGGALGPAPQPRAGLAPPPTAPKKEEEKRGMGTETERERERFISIHPVNPRGATKQFCPGHKGAGGERDRLVRLKEGSECGGCGAPTALLPVFLSRPSSSPWAAGEAALRPRVRGPGGAGLERRPGPGVPPPTSCSSCSQPPPTPLQYRP